MTTTTEIARTHGYTGPIICHGCGTTQQLHFCSWAQPETGESGDFIECCACGIKAGDPVDVHADCEPAEIDEDQIEDEETGPEVRVFRRAAGWVMTGSEPEECTTNFHRQQDGRPTCAEAAVWKVVEDHGMHLTIGFYCDADLPAEHKPPQAA